MADLYPAINMKEDKKGLGSGQFRNLQMGWDPLDLADPQATHIKTTACYVVVGGRWFFVHPIAVATVELAQLEHLSTGQYIPATIISTGLHTSYSGLKIGEVIKNFERRDDVWSRSFLAGKPSLARLSNNCMSAYQI